MPTRLEQAAQAVLAAENLAPQLRVYALDELRLALNVPLVEVVPPPQAYQRKPKTYIDPIFGRERRVDGRPFNEPLPPPFGWVRPEDVAHFTPTATAHGRIYPFDPGQGAFPLFKEES